MRIESIIASVLIIISLIHSDMPDWFVVAIPSAIFGFTIVFGYMNQMLSYTYEYYRYAHLSIVCIPCIIAPAAVIVDPDNALVALWLRISGVVACILFSVLLYNTIDKGCTLEFKNTCFKGVLADLSLLGIIPAALDIYFGWWSIGSGISLFLTLAYGFYLLYEPNNSSRVRALTDNGEQQRLFGSINDEDI
tara:strand:+ start:603 stop:1178 length:576 start_codon:yes stop_codon:yes gene_type:complete